MSIGNVKKFISRAMSDQSLRDELNKAPSLIALHSILEERGYPFTPHDFDEAYHNLLTQCEFIEQEEKLNEFKMWWEMLHHFLGGSSEPQTSSCSSTSPCSARGSCSGCGS